MADDPEPPSRLRTIIGIAVLALALWGGWVLSQRMIANSRLEDCLMAGRRNCMPIDKQGTVQPPR